MDLKKRSPACRAGLRNDDLIREVEGLPTRSVPEFKKVLKSLGLRPGMKVRLTYKRWGKTCESTLECGCKGMSIQTWHELCQKIGTEGQLDSSHWQWTKRRNEEARQLRFLLDCKRVSAETAKWCEKVDERLKKRQHERKSHALAVEFCRGVAGLIVQLAWATVTDKEHTEKERHTRAVFELAKLKNERHSLMNKRAKLCAYTGMDSREYRSTIASRQRNGPGRYEVVELCNIVDGSPASLAGLREFDLVESVNGKLTKHVKMFEVALAAAEPGDTVTLQILRPKPKAQPKPPTTDDPNGQQPSTGTAKTDDDTQTKTSKHTSQPDSSAENGSTSQPVKVVARLVARRITAHTFV